MIAFLPNLKRQKEEDKDLVEKGARRDFLIRWKFRRKGEQNKSDFFHDLSWHARRKKKRCFNQPWVALLKIRKRFELVEKNKSKKILNELRGVEYMKKKRKEKKNKWLQCETKDGEEILILLLWEVDKEHRMNRSQALLFHGACRNMILMAGIIFRDHLHSELCMLKQEALKRNREEFHTIEIKELFIVPSTYVRTKSRYLITVTTTSNSLLQ